MTRLCAFALLIFDILLSVLIGVAVGVLVIVSGFGFFAYPIGAFAGVMVFLCLCEE